MSIGLVVPIRLEALPIGARDTGTDVFLPPYADFAVLPAQGSSSGIPYLSSNVTSQPFTGTHALEQGIHLHWNLPQALRTGVVDADGTLALPGAPDRWLVTRVLADVSDPAHPAVTLTSWVVESDHLWPNGTYSPTAVPAFPRWRSRWCWGAWSG